MIIDLDKLIRDHKYEAEITPPESEKDGELRRFKERAAFTAALGLVVLTTLLLIGWLAFGTPSVEDKKWIFGLLGIVLTACVAKLWK
jgi:hypothetical protein